MSPFTRTLCVGALAAASLPVALLFLAPAFGAANVLVLHAVVCTAGWLGWLAGDARQRLGVGATVAGLGLLGWLLAGSVASGVVALAVVVAGVRSGWLYRRRGLRAVVVEAAVLLGACATAGFLFRPGLAGAALAAWGWFVVQSFYFLLGGLERRRAPLRGDAFEEAARRLESLLDAPG